MDTLWLFFGLGVACVIVFMWLVPRKSNSTIQNHADAVEHVEDMIIYMNDVIDYIEHNLSPQLSGDNKAREYALMAKVYMEKLRGALP